MFIRSYVILFGLLTLAANCDDPVSEDRNEDTEETAPVDDDTASVNNLLFLGFSTGKMQAFAQKGQASILVPADFDDQMKIFDKSILPADSNLYECMKTAHVLKRGKEEQLHKKKFKNSLLLLQNSRLQAKNIEKLPNGDLEIRIKNKKNAKKFRILDCELLSK